MCASITQHSNEFSFCPQITVDDIQEIKSLGFKTIVNDRPDNEGSADQPQSEQIKIEAEAIGLSYYYIPVTPGNITTENLAEYATLLVSAPMPILGFCRTGNRAITIYQRSLAEQKPS